jgi:hypothetical protein
MDIPLKEYRILCARCKICKIPITKFQITNKFEFFNDLNDKKVWL